MVLLSEQIEKEQQIEEEQNDTEQIEKEQNEKEQSNAPEQIEPEQIEKEQFSESEQKETEWDKTEENNKEPDLLEIKIGEKEYETLDLEELKLYRQTRTDRHEAAFWDSYINDSWLLNHLWIIGLIDVFARQKLVTVARRVIWR